MSPQTATRRIDLTYEDYVLFPEDGKRHEIIDGDHYVTPAPERQASAGFIQSEQTVRGLPGQDPRGSGSQRSLRRRSFDRDVVQPDLLRLKARAAIVTEKNIQGPPDLVVEIVSETTRKTDEVLKRHLYERHGVQEYWIVDPEIEAVKVYRVTENGYVRRPISPERPARALRALSFGLDVPLAELFAD